MKLRALENQTSVSVGGVEYPVVNGSVEIPDDAAGDAVSHLVGVHGFAIGDSSDESTQKDFQNAGEEVEIVETLPVPEALAEAPETPESTAADAPATRRGRKAQ